MPAKPFPFFILIALLACETKQEDYAEEKARAPFEQAFSLGQVSAANLDEISGIVASRRYPGYYWVHNDSGGDPSVYLIDSTGSLVAEARLAGIMNRDWEDIAIGPGGNGEGHILYVADIGDNRAVHSSSFIYAFPEPIFDLGSAELYLPVASFSTFEYVYPDGARDAETLLVDPANNDFMIVSKREENVFLYHWPSPRQTNEPFVVQKITSLPFWMIVGGDISENGRELLLKDYESVFYWKNDATTPWVEALKSNPHRLPYIPEPQGEAIGFTAKANGFVTISEREKLSGSPHLYFYNRKPPE